MTFLANKVAMFFRGNALWSKQQSEKEHKKCFICVLWLLLELEDFVSRRSWDGLIMRCDHSLHYVLSSVQSCFWIHIMFSLLTDPNMDELVLLIKVLHFVKLEYTIKPFGWSITTKIWYGKNSVQSVRRKLRMVKFPNSENFIRWKIPRRKFRPRAQETSEIIF